MTPLCVELARARARRREAILAADRHADARLRWLLTALVLAMTVTALASLVVIAVR